MERRTEVEVDAPAERLWAVVQDVRRWPDLVETVTSVELLDDGPLAVGSRARVTQPRLPTSEYVVTALEPGRAFTWETTSPGVRVTASHEVGAGRRGAQPLAAVGDAGPNDGVSRRRPRSPTGRCPRDR